jgi:hypothetical protein
VVVQNFGTLKKNSGAPNTFTAGKPARKGFNAPLFPTGAHNTISHAGSAINTPQPGKKFLKSPHALDNLISKTSSAQAAQQENAKKQEKVKELEKELETSQSQVSEKAPILAHVEVQLLKVEREVQKSKKELEDTVKSISKKQAEIVELQLKDFEAQTEIQLSQKKLEILNTMLSNLQQKNSSLQEQLQNELTQKIKDGWSTLSETDKVGEGLKALSRMTNSIVQLFTDPNSTIRSIDEVQTALKKPEMLFDSFLETNEQALIGLLNTNGAGSTPSHGRDRKGSGLTLKDVIQDPHPKIVIDTASPMITSSSSEAVQRARLSSAIRTLFKGFLQKGGAKQGNSQTPTDKDANMVKSQLATSLFLKQSNDYSKQYDKRRDSSISKMRAANGLADSQIASSIHDENSAIGLKQDYLMPQKLARNQSQPHYNIEDDSEYADRDPNMNESHLDQSYFLVIENVFSMLDTLFQRVKSHVKHVYEDCIEAMESIKGSRDNPLCQRLKQYSYP